MQMQHEITTQQRELEVEVMKQKKKCGNKMEQEKWKEQCKVDLVKEGKMSVSELIDQTTAAGTPSAARFDIADNLKSLPKFTDKDPDTFFWPDQDCTFMLQCILTGKAQKAYAALTTEDCKDFPKVKAAVLKTYEFVPESNRRQFRNWRKSEGQTCRI